MNHLDTLTEGFKKQEETEKSTGYNLGDRVTYKEKMVGW